MHRYYHIDHNGDGVAMFTLTREEVNGSCAKWGSGQPLSEKKIAGMLKVLNAPLTPTVKPVTLCGHEYDALKATLVVIATLDGIVRLTKFLESEQPTQVRCSAHSQPHGPLSTLSFPLPDTA
jgi:hypothetical protein